MIEKYSFFDAEVASDGNFDRTYNSKDIADYFASFVGDGVFGGDSTNGLKVVPADGGVSVLEGKAFIDGYYYELAEGAKDIPIDAGDALYPRIDSVVCSLNHSKRMIEIKLVKGTPSAAPKPQNPIRTATVHDLVLAHVYVKAGGVKVFAENITDTRFDKSLCGIVTGAVEQIDTTELFAQYDAEFNSWFETIKGTLSGDVAANLASQIETVDARVDVVTNQVNAMPIIRSGVDAPDDSVGVDGDVYIQIFA